MGSAFAFGEALALGLASGPVCVASCGPVLVPSLLAGRAGIRPNSHYLFLFLATRLLGYLVFATVAWEVGTSVSLRAPVRPLVFGAIHLLLAGALLLYAYSAGRMCACSPAGSALVTIGGNGKHKVPGAAVLGFLTGVSLCPPFVLASVRAAEAASITAALLFFTAFFIGTTIWFVPFAGLGWVKRNQAVITVARMAMVLIAFYYSYAGLMILIGRNAYGY
ncbi:MAG TPA: sulfite exporter TauE/SafE family protein [Dongiaceae bacterium]|nr:sulfite exporter TauE/SafE family protein [Dongiaceae bacterium]